jgi:hypothetical protein
MSADLDTLFQEENATIEFYWLSPLILESNSNNPINYRVEYKIIRAKKFETHSSLWSNAEPEGEYENESTFPWSLASYCYIFACMST